MEENLKVILEDTSSAGNVLGRQKYKGGICRRMRYVLEEEDGGGLLLLNSVTGKLVRLGAGAAACWRALPGELPEAMKELYAGYFIVPEAFDEPLVVEQVRKVLRITEMTEDITNYTILPTSACNARCFYCFESVYEHRTMTEETADAVAGFISEHRGGKPVSLHWFGGEPLVGQTRISQICARLREAGVEYSSMMISNGYLFTPENIQTAREEWKLSMVQITLDGTEEVYNRTKAYVGVAGSPYRRVLRNIGLLLDAGVKVHVRMNLSLENAEDLMRLSEELSESFSGKEGFYCYAHELFDQEGFEPVRYSREEWGAIMQQRYRLERRIRELGLAPQGRKKGQSGMQAFSCMADNPSSVVINPLGELIKCEHYVYGHSLGDVWHGVTDQEAWQRWMDSSYSSVCEDCELYPECADMTSCPTYAPCLPVKREGILEEKRSWMRKMAEAKADKPLEEK